MELSVAVLVLCLVGAAIVGFGVAHVLHRLRSRRRRLDEARTEDRLGAIELELDDAIHRSRRELQRSNRLRVERDDAREEIEELRADLHEAEQRQVRDEDRIAVAERHADEFRARFSDIVGLENEIASLRVIAARVPELQRRLDDLTGDDRVIDLRDPQRSERAG
ncbi:MAG: hypothetical protein AAF480_18735 [Actinomycetota bacterium]